MGSVTVSEVVHDTAHFPRSTMLATEPHAPYQHPHSQTPSSASSVSTHPNAATSAISSRSQASTPPSSDHHHNQAAISPDAGPETGPLHPSQHNQQFSTQPSTASSTAQSSVSSLHARSASPSPKRIKIKDLNHIQSFVEDEHSIASKAATGQVPADKTQELPQYEISGMPVTDVIEMVAGLLTKITTTNDDQAERLHKNMPSPEYAAKINPLANSVLAFHGKNIPTISITSYLSRIHKYCPATYEVFLSLLVYFDRITEKINSSSKDAAREHVREPTPRPLSRDSDAVSRTEDRGQSFSHDLRGGEYTRQLHTERPATSEYPSPPPSEPDPYNLAQCFVVDSFNIHRLIIAGVTCASKFFSDVFYTNSRYAKVMLSTLPEN